MLQEMNNDDHICDCCLNKRSRIIGIRDRSKMILPKERYTNEDCVIFAKIIKGILSYELAETMTYDEAVEHYAGSKENTILYNQASYIHFDSKSRREAHSIALDFVFSDILGFKKHCQSCSIALTKAICRSNINSIQTLEIVLSEFVIGILKRNKRDRYGTFNKDKQPKSKKGAS